MDQRVSDAAGNIKHGCRGNAGEAAERAVILPHHQCADDLAGRAIIVGGGVWLNLTAFPSTVRAEPVEAQVACHGLEHTQDERGSRF
jgi:hypothetical protein